MESKEYSQLWGFSPFYKESPYFVGRQQELNLLRNRYESGKQLGFISGTRSIGKTSLALVFSVIAKDLFPGGVFRRHAFPEFVLDQNIEKLFSARALTIIDDADFLDSEAVKKLEPLLQRNKNFNLLIVGMRPPSFRFKGQFSIILHEFSEAEVSSFLQKSLKFFDSQIITDLYRILGGNPLAIARAAYAIHEKGFSWDELLGGIQDFRYTGIVGLDGRPLRIDSKERLKIISDVSSTNQNVLTMLRKDPNRWFQLSPRKFEEIIAELLSKLGYDITLTPTTKDGGFDMFAATKEGLGEFLFIVECKRYTPPNKVGVEVVRALQGVLSEHRANGAAIFTTSFFTTGCVEFQRKFQYQLKLHDYLALQKLLKIID